ncbi:MAG: DoxX family protein [Kofleriaceae bacterium]
MTAAEASRAGRHKTALRWLLTVGMVGAGANHFVSPEPYLGMMPSALPAPLALVYLSGVAEIAGGLGLILPSTRRVAAWGLVALLVAVFPANVNMAINQLPLGTTVVPTWALWARLPLQAVFIAWAWWYTRPAAQA